VQSGLEVQFVSNFDHIMVLFCPDVAYLHLDSPPQVAIHFNVSSMFLPTETFFDDVSWWSGQFIYNVVAAFFFPQQWIQINSLKCENLEHRNNEQASESPGAAPTKAYKRITSFEKPLLFIVSSFKLSESKLYLFPALFLMLILTKRQGLDTKIQFRYWQFFAVASAVSRLPCHQVWDFCCLHS
jgi:hypothetical protein